MPNCSNDHQPARALGGLRHLAVLVDLTDGGSWAIFENLVRVGLTSRLDQDSSEYEGQSTE